MTSLLSRIKRTPISCVWEITNACNLRCTHCESESGKKRTQELSLDEACILAEELKSAGCRVVNLTGGEPLLRSDWPQIAQKLKDLHITVHLITNGLLLNAATINTACKAGVYGVAISLNGDKDAHDKLCCPPSRIKMTSPYDAALKAIAIVSQSPLKCAIITVIHKKNLHLLEHMYELAVQLKIDSWQVQLAIPSGRMKPLEATQCLGSTDILQLESRLAALVKRNEIPICTADNIGYYGTHEPVIRGSLNRTASFWQGCVAGMQAVSINSNGGIKGCPSQPDSLIVGNIRKDSFLDIWNDRNRFWYNTQWNHTLLEGDCAKCAHATRCRAGCTAMATAATGSIYTNPYCLQRALHATNK